jgi:hypothetical protein
VERLLTRFEKNISPKTKASMTALSNLMSPLFNYSAYREHIKVASQKLLFHLSFHLLFSPSIERRYKVGSIPSCSSERPDSCGRDAKL